MAININCNGGSFLNSYLEQINVVLINLLYSMKFDCYRTSE